MPSISVLLVTLLIGIGIDRGPTALSAIHPTKDLHANIGEVLLVVHSSELSSKYQL
jgi:hypothetical protein